MLNCIRLLFIQAIYEGHAIYSNTALYNYLNVTWIKNEHTAGKHSTISLKSSGGYRTMNICCKHSLDMLAEIYSYRLGITTH